MNAVRVVECGAAHGGRRTWWGARHGAGRGAGDAAQRRSVGHGMATHLVRQSVLLPGTAGREEMVGHRMRASVRHISLVYDTRPHRRQKVSE